MPNRHAHLLFMETINAGVNMYTDNKYAFPESRIFNRMSSSDNSRSLKEWLQVFVQTPQLQARLYQTRIEQFWPQLMGELISGYTKSIRLEGHTLKLRIESAPLKAELSMMKADIMLRINERLGEAYINEVIIY